MSYGNLCAGHVMLTAWHAPPMIVPPLLLHELSAPLHAPPMRVPLLFSQELEAPLHAPNIFVPAIVLFGVAVSYLDLCSRVRQFRQSDSHRPTLLGSKTFHRGDAIRPPTPMPWRG